MKTKTSSLMDGTNTLNKLTEEHNKRVQKLLDKDIFEQATVAMEEHYGYGFENEIDAYFRGAKWMQKQFIKMKKTAVEWLQEELKGVYESEYFNLKIKEALEMEKQQIIDAFESGVYDGGENVSQYNMNSEQYYNETFKSE